MLPLQSQLIDLYRWASWPLRKLRLQQMKRAGKVPIGVLFYHRVDDQYPNPWTITESAFEEQIDWYSKNFELVDLAECQRRIRSGHNDRPTLTITFDDGYADNCAFALPMLIERRIPVTYFVTTRHIVKVRHFEHDVEREQPLEPNSVESLQAMVAAGVEIGAHTRTHLDLGTVADPEILFDEVIRATREMEQLIDQKIRYFAFPFGLKENLNPAVFRLLKKHGFSGACSAYGGFNAIGDDAFHLQRFHGDCSFSRMKNWLTYDPRVSTRKMYNYETEAGIELDCPASELANQAANHSTNNSANQPSETNVFPNLQADDPSADSSIPSSA